MENTFHQPELGTVIGFIKSDDEQRMVFGWANVAITKSGEQIVDAHGESIDIDELEAAAYDFVLEFRATGTSHVGKTKGRLVESFLVTPEKLEAMGLAKDALPLGWWVGFKIDDDAAWEGVKKGDYRMFSIQGLAVPVEA